MEELIKIVETKKDKMCRRIFQKNKKVSKIELEYLYKYQELLLNLYSKLEK